MVCAPCTRQSVRNAPHTEVCAALQCQTQKAHSDEIIKLLLVMLRRAESRKHQLEAAMTVVNDGVMMLSEPESFVCQSAFRLGFPTGEVRVTDRAPNGPNRVAGPAGLCDGDHKKFF